MADRPQDDFDNEPEEVDTNRAVQQGLGVGARELAAIGESGEKGTLEGGTEKRKADETIESDTGRAASVLDRK
ncbi:MULTISPECIES: hypothetical protein [unclassified Brevundimonas]|uniref:hypothetical protein n=1 Tax=unclassified Brevundimonas TaxID=2622653 RepID=UPI0025B9C03E|nr:MULTISPECIES: hypothetical protein [unclassified Brevundimonas]